jgi:hypothetical protein
LRSQHRRSCIIPADAAAAATRRSGRRYPRATASSLGHGEEEHCAPMAAMPPRVTKAALFCPVRCQRSRESVLCHGSRNSYACASGARPCEGHSPSSRVGQNATRRCGIGGFTYAVASRDGQGGATRRLQPSWWQAPRRTSRRGCRASWTCQRIAASWCFQALASRPAAADPACSPVRGGRGTTKRKGGASTPQLTWGRQGKDADGRSFGRSGFGVSSNAS